MLTAQLTRKLKILMSKTIFEAYNECKKQLADADIPDCVFEAKQIIKHVTGYSNAQILANYNRPLTQFQENLLTVIVKQRLVHYPLQYIIGRWSFFGHEFFVGPGVLIPRADTETVMDVCMEYINGDREYKVLDLCAGTGCIGISIAAERENAKVTLVEKYSEALSYLNKNVEHNGVSVEVKQGDIFDACAADKKYDLIVSNPPYITDSDMKTLQPEVKLEPETALAGGKDGLDFYRAIIKNYRQSLKDGGMLVFEVGINEASAVALMMTAAGFENVGTRADINDIDRVVFGTVGAL